MHKCNLYSAKTLILLIFSASVVLLGCTTRDFYYYGGEYNQYAEAVIQTNDGCFVIAGASEAADGYSADFHIFKVDAHGNQLWSKIYGEIGTDDWARSINQTSDGGYIVAGETESYGTPDEYGNRCNFWVMKLNSLGNRVWEKFYGSPERDGAFSLKTTSDGGYIVAGYTHSYDGMGMKVYKLDAAGNIEWEGLYDTGLVAYAVEQTSDGGYVIAGNAAPFQSPNEDTALVVVKLDAEGNAVWAHKYGDTRFEFARSIRQTIDGGYIVAGYQSEDFFEDKPANAWILKLDAAGGITWQQTIGGSRFDAAYSVALDSDGGYVFAGKTHSYGFGSANSADAWVGKLSAGGEMLWLKSFGDIENNQAGSIIQKNDGGFAVTGFTYTGRKNKNDSFLLLLDRNGNSQKTD